MSGFKAQWRWLSWVLMAIVGVAALVIGAAADGGTKSEGEQMSELASTIRCPQCRGQAVSESDVAIAREIRADIRTRISAGESNDEILQVYIDRYGRSIVLTPDSGGFTGLVWIVPVVAAGLAIAAIGLAFQRWRAEAESMQAATEADRELVASLRRKKL